MNTPRAELRRLLVATDFSGGAEAALARCLELPLAAGATITLLHAIPETLPSPAAAPAIERARGRLERAAEGARLELAGRGVAATFECAVARGRAHVEIVRHARSIGAELVVLGRHGHRGLRDLLVGSTAERVVRKGDVPILLVAAPPAGAYARPIAALDLTDASPRVLELARTLLPAGQSALRLVHAFHVGFDEWLAGEALESARREYREVARGRAAALAGATGETKALDGLVLIEGDPRLVILHEAMRERADLVVVGTHARTGLSHALLGSTAEWIVQAAPCDVAVTRPARFTFELP